MADYNSADIYMKYCDMMRQYREEEKNKKDATRQQLASDEIARIQSNDWYKGADAKQGIIDKALEKIGIRTKDTKSVLANNDIKRLKAIAYGYDDEKDQEDYDFNNITGGQKNADWLTRFLYQDTAQNNKTTAVYNRQHNIY